MRTLEDAIKERIEEKRAAAAAEAKRREEKRLASQKRCEAAMRWLRGQIEDEYKFSTDELEITAQERAGDWYHIVIERSSGYIEAPPICNDTTDGSFDGEFRWLPRDMNQRYWHAVKRERADNLFCDYDDLIDAIMYVDGVDWRRAEEGA